MERQAEAWAQQGRSCLQDGEDGQEAQGIGVWRVCWLWSGHVMGGAVTSGYEVIWQGHWAQFKPGAPVTTHPQHMPSMSLWACAASWGWPCSIHPVGAPLAPLSHSPGAAAWSMARRMDR